MRTRIIFLVFSIAFVVGAKAQVKVDVDFGKRGPVITSDHYGVFFEELSHAGDGGLYAEMIQNRSFEDDTSTPVHWSAIGNAKIELTTNKMMNVHQGHALLLNIINSGDGVKNDGYWGISVESGTSYDVSFWIRSDEEWDGYVTGMFIDSKNNQVGRKSINVTSSDEWQQYKMKITATGGDGGGTFELHFSNPGKLMLDMVSVFPPTFMNRENGMRKDLAQMFADLNPAFMRFPGGCYSEGTFDRGSDCRYIWKHSVGKQEERIPLWNSKWGYTVTQGQGIYEYLQLCEDMGAIPMYVVNIGLGHGWVHDKNDLDEYIQEALDVLEYANGDVTTTWGRKRAEAGHPEPFGMKYIEIGNENANWIFDNNTDQSQEYFDRYIQFYTAIHQNYPDVVIIGNVQAWGTDYPTWRSNHPVDVLDEHYYRDPEWFKQHYNHYDNYSRSGPTVYVGEYSANTNNGYYGTMFGAACEAIFMEGMENNSDVVRMTSYSEPYAHNNDYRWRAMMFYDNRNSFGTPSYYAQKMFSNNVGRQNVKWTEQNNGIGTENLRSIGLGTWSTSSTYTDILAVDAEGNVLFDGSDTQAGDWVNEAGNWTVNNGVIKQSTTSGTRSTYTLVNTINTENMTYTMKAKKISGAEGFLIIFDFQDVNNYAWWAIGGWGNVQHGVEQSINGTKSTLAATPGSVVAGREYDIKIVKEGRHVCCYLDGTLMHEFDLLTSQDRNVYVAASVTDDTGDGFIKLVNPNSTQQNVHLSFKNGKVESGTAEILNSNNPMEENTLDNPKAIVPHQSDITVNSDGSIDFIAVPYSINIIKLKVSDIKISEETSESVPDADICYSFTEGVPADDSGKHQGTLCGESQIVTLSDGNNVLYTGRIGGGGYMDLGNDVLDDVLGATEEFTISVNVNHNILNNLNRFCWIYAFANGTDRYVALVNGPSNADWYYEVKNTKLEGTHSYSSLLIEKWHNVTYTQKNNVGKIYLDGQLLGVSDIGILPKDISTNIAESFIGRSPFPSDAIMEGMYVDDFKMFSTALSEKQVKELAKTANEIANPDNKDFSTLYKLKELVDIVEPVCDFTADENLKDIQETAKKALESKDLELCEELYEILYQTFEDYKVSEIEKMENGNAAELTFMLTNSSFINKDQGWVGTPFTAIAYQTAEMWNKRFEFYQTLDDMPAGIYSLRASAYYRAGGIEAGYSNYQNNTPESLYAELFINENTSPLQNFYSETEEYTYQPFTYPNNLYNAYRALNELELYSDNEITYLLKEKGSLKIGIRKSKPLAEDWAAFDRFQLTYLGNETTDIQLLNTSDVVRRQWYNLSGIQTNNPQHGIYILKETLENGVINIHKVFVP